VLGANKPAFDPTTAIVILNFIPLLILAKTSERTCAMTLPGLNANILPIVPSLKEYQSQGKTVEAAIIDITKPLGRSKQPLFDLYITLSKCLEPRNNCVETVLVAPLATCR
jgi:hypothetical protein